MTALRRFLAQRHLALALCVATLLLKLLVPTGYMIGGGHGHVTIAPCPGVVYSAAAMEMPGMRGAMPDHGRPGHGGRDHGKADMPCAFAGLSVAALGASDPIPLAAPIAFAVVVGTHLAPVPAAFRRAHLRPPLRGPPAGH